MKLDRQTVARVNALVLDLSPVDIEGSAKSAERKIPYLTAERDCYFVIGRGDKIIPLNDLTKVSYAKSLTLVFPYDAVTVRIFPILWLIEIARKSDNGESNFYINIVGDIGKDAFTRETRYGFIRFGSTIDLLEEMDKQVGEEKVRHLRKMQKEYSWKDVPGGALRLCNAYITGALKNKLVSSPNATATLRKKESQTIEEVIEAFEASKKPVTPEMMGKKLTFKVHKEDNTALVDPRWRKTEVENAECPNCNNTMVVIFGYNQMLYAWCARCQQYYIGE